MATIEGFEVELDAVFGPTLIAVLGRRDFFTRFRIEFDERSRVSYLTPY